MPRRVSPSLLPVLLAAALVCAGAPLRAQNDTTRQGRGQTGQTGQTDGQGQTTQTSGGGVSGPSIGVRVRIPTQVTVPDLTGMSVTLARIRLITGNLVPGGVDSTAAPGARRGRIVAQDPAPGTVVRPGTRVRMTIANRAPAPVAPPPPTKPAVELVAVPNLAGRTVAEAREAVGGARLLLGVVDSATSQSAAAGTVVRQVPAAGDSVQPGTAVAIVVARQQRVTVPPLAGQTLPEARRTLEAARLQAGAVSEKEAPGRPLVISQSIPAGTSVLPGTTVNLTVSRAPVIAPAPPPVAAAPPPAVAPPPAAQPTDTAPAATQPPAPATHPVVQPVDSAAAAQPVPAPAAAPIRAAEPARPQPAVPARTTRIPREAWWALLALVLVAVAAATAMRLRRRPRATAAPAATTPPVAVRMRVSAGESRTRHHSEQATSGARVKLNVRIAEPRPSDANAGQAPLAAGRVAVRSANGDAPKLVEQPASVGAGKRVHVQVRGDEPAFRAVDGGPVILKRR